MRYRLQPTISSSPPASPRPSGPRGFALIITLSMMILLSLLAVGLLGLSTISLKGSSRGEAMQRARANARMGMMMALGDLQKHAGPDTRITASGSIIDTPDPAMEHVAGVWSSWKIDPASSPSARDYERTGGKTERFRKWLVSSADPTATGEMSFASSPGGADRIPLVPSPSGSDAAPVYGGLVPVEDPYRSDASGAFAYAVLDEGVKARIDTGFHPTEGGGIGDRALTMGSGLRADTTRIDALKELDWDAADLSSESCMVDKVVSFGTAGLLAKNLGGAESLGRHYHDITTRSVGIFANVSDGGLKEDLNSILNSESLPDDFSGGENARMYAGHLGFPVDEASRDTGEVEPGWDRIHDFANLYRTALRDSNGPVLAMRPNTKWRQNPTRPLSKPPYPAPSESVIQPHLAKVQIFFSLVAVPLWRNGNHVSDPNGKPPENNWTETEGSLMAWQRSAWQKGARYFLMLCMSPSVTLHNPYNSSLEVRDLEIEVSNMPLAIQIQRVSGVGTSDWLPKNGQGVDMVDSVVDRSSNGRKFLFRLGGGENGEQARFTLAPGEIRVFGPTVPANSDYLSNPYRAWNAFSDPDNAKPMDLAQGYRGAAIGFYLPRLTNNELRGYETYPSPNGRGSLEYLAPNDRVRVRIRPCLDMRIPEDPRLRDDIGVCKVSMVRAGTNGQFVYSMMNFDLGTGTRDSGQRNLITSLEKALGLPASGQELEGVTAREMGGDTGAQPLNSMPIYTFAAITLSAKTTFGDFLGKDDDGALAAKPMAFHSPVTAYSMADVENSGLEASPYEAAVIPLDSANGTGIENHLEINADGRSYGISGLTSLNGQQFGTFYEIPSGPLRNFSQLNSANLAATHSLARFAYPVGNSWAHPMIPSDAVRQPAPSSGIGEALDHSFLLNSLLFDRFYFSGIAPREGELMSGVTTRSLAESFVTGDGSARLPDSRMVPHLPESGSEAGAIEALSLAHAADPTEAQARFSAAGHQLMRGAFNVNSTSVTAWKAMLASLHPQDVDMFRVDAGTPAGAVERMEAMEGGNARFSTFSIPNNEPARDASETQNFFQGPRDIDAEQLDGLARRIVEEVRERGPFLSMAEFVNRRLGGGELARKGAIQAAIDATEINTGAVTAAGTGYRIESASGDFVNPDAMLGRSDQGAPGFLTQADVLAVLGNAATVRSDTFTIRAYGDARDPSGRSIARAWCEAVVQRMPEYVSPVDRHDVKPDDLESEVNRNFGRRFVIRSFRWLSPEEISSAT